MASGAPGRVGAPEKKWLFAGGCVLACDVAIELRHANGEALQRDGVVYGKTIALNRNIRAIAQAENVRCIDLEKEFTSGPDPLYAEWPMTDAALMEPDGLHPNDAGTQIIALACADQF